MKKEAKDIIMQTKYLVIIAVVVLITIAIFLSTVTIKTGTKGILLRFGNAIEVRDAGLSFKIPFVDKVVLMTVREQNIQGTYSVSSKDIQTIIVAVNIQFAITGDVLELYKNFGVDYKVRLIQPRVAETINAVVARYTIEEFVEKRNALALELLKELKQDFASYGITVSASSIIEHEFSEEFDKSIEAKKIAEQNALRAKNDLERVKYEAQAEIAKSQGIAQANRIVETSLSDRLIRQKMIDKWDGKLPLYQGGDGASTIFSLPNR